MSQLADRKRAFMEEYEKLVRAHGCYVWSCGCCGPEIGHGDNKDVDDHLSSLRNGLSWYPSQRPSR